MRSAPLNFSYGKVKCKNKNPWIWDKKCLIWVFWGWNLKIMSYLKSAASNLSNCKISKKKMKMPKFGTKKYLIWVFLGKNLKNYGHIWHQHPRCCLITKFCEETRMSKFGTKNALLRVFLTKNALIGYFWIGILKKYCHIWNQHPWICFAAKFSVKIHILKFGTKNAWVRYFWVGIWK